MKSLAIDVRALMSDALTGIGVYEYKLIEALITTNPDIAFKLWTAGANLGNINHIERLTQIRQDQHLHYNKSNRYFNLLCAAGWSGSSLYKQIESDNYFFPHPNFIPLPAPKPFVVTVHDLSFLHQPSWYDVKGRLWHYALRLNEVLTAAHDIIAVSESTAESIQHFFPQITSAKIRVIHNGLTHDVLSQAEVQSIEEKLQLPSSFLLYVGTLEPRKNLASVIAAYLEVRKSNPDLKLVIAGKFGWSQNQQVLRKRYQSDLIWLDYVSEREKFALYQLARVFIWPSFYEGFGFPPLEAAVYGTPVITSFTTAMPELLENNAWYVNPYNYQELAQVILQVLALPVERKLNLNLLNRYNWQAAAEKTLTLINNL